jgi:putative ubiquitin-RnfH superfamily antitoxin RatB of RatAB toxin-antitoxin module
MVPMPTHFEVEVVYALPAVQELLTVRVEDGATVEQAIHASGVLDRYPEIVLKRTTVGVFGKIVALDARVRAGDRVEIYRPLTVDPKEARRRRGKRRLR